MYYWYHAICCVTAGTVLQEDVPFGTPFADMKYAKHTIHDGKTVSLAEVVGSLAVEPV